MTKDRQICFRRSLHYFYELSVAVCCIRHVAFIRSIAVGILWRILVRCVLWAVWCIWCVAWNSLNCLMHLMNLSPNGMKMEARLSRRKSGRLYDNVCFTVLCYESPSVQWFRRRTKLRRFLLCSFLLYITLKDLLQVSGSWKPLTFGLLAYP